MNNIRRALILLFWSLSGLALFLLVLRSPSTTIAAPACNPLSALGNVITVCLSGECDYSSIQDAVNAAEEGGTIKVAAGTYTAVETRPAPPPYPPPADVITQVVYIDKTVRIRGGYTTTNWSTSDPSANLTTLDAQEQGRVLYITGDISPTIEGLRITGGDAAGLRGGPEGEHWIFHDAGGGVYATGATITFSNNQVFSNTVSGDDAFGGGGLFLYGCDGILSNNIVSANSGRDGGGLWLSESSVTLKGNTVSTNTGFAGGGLFLSGGDVTLRGNLVNGNSAFEGGGIYLSESGGMVSRNVVRDNDATFGGGGFYLIGSSATVVANNINSNTSGRGGGLYLGASEATLSGNVVTGNIASNGGGLYLSEESDATLANDVIAENQASESGCGLQIEASSPRLFHTTLARNTGGDGSAIHATYGYVAKPRVYSNVELTNTIVVSHTVGVSVTAGSKVALDSTLWHGNMALSGGAGVICHTNDYIGDPGFVDTEGDDYHIGPGSAAIDQGIDAGVHTDMDYQPRPYQAPDLGADEYWPPGVLKYTYLPLAFKN